MIAITNTYTHILLFTVALLPVLFVDTIYFLIIFLHLRLRYYFGILLGVDFLISSAKLNWHRSWDFYDWYWFEILKWLQWTTICLVNKVIKHFRLPILPLRCSLQAFPCISWFRPCHFIVVSVHHVVWYESKQRPATSCVGDYGAVIHHVASQSSRVEMAIQRNWSF